MTIVSFIPYFRLLVFGILVTLVAWFFFQFFSVLPILPCKMKIMFHFISQRFAASVEPLVFGYGSKETLHIQSSTWPRGVCQLGHGHRGCLLQMCSRLHHSPQVQQWSQSQRGNWLLEVTTYFTYFPYSPFQGWRPPTLWKTHQKVKILWEGHKNLKKSPTLFDVYFVTSKELEDFFNFF